MSDTMGKGMVKTLQDHDDEKFYMPNLLSFAVLIVRSDFVSVGKHFRSWHTSVPAWTVIICWKIRFTKKIFIRVVINILLFDF